MACFAYNGRGLQLPGMFAQGQLFRDRGLCRKVASETSSETEASIKAYMGSCITAQRVRMWPHFSGHPHTQLKTTGNNIMSIEGTPESHLPTLSDSEQPSPRHGAWLRIIGLIVVVCLGVVVWRRLEEH